MSTDTVVRVRIDSHTKARAAEALQAMGLTMSGAIRLLLIRVANEQRLPFAVQVPNLETVNAMKEVEESKGRRFDNVEALIEDLDS